MIYFADSVDETHVSYINEAINILNGINIYFNQTVLFKVEKIKNNCLGMTIKESNKYIIKLNERLLKEKDSWINTIIHEIIHVITDLKGSNCGHGKEFHKIADYITQNTKYIITRHAHDNLPETKENNSFSNLNQSEQKIKLDTMIKNREEELILKFSSIYYTLKSEELKNRLTIYFIEHFYLPQIDKKTNIFKFPYYAFNTKCRELIADNYVAGKYDTLIDTINKACTFDSLFSLKKEYEKVSDYSKRRFPPNSI